MDSYIKSDLKWSINFIKIRQGGGSQDARIISDSLIPILYIYIFHNQIHVSLIYFTSLNEKAFKCILSSIDSTNIDFNHAWKIHSSIKLTFYFILEKC